MSPPRASCMGQAILCCSAESRRRGFARRAHQPLLFTCALLVGIVLVKGVTVWGRLDRMDPAVRGGVCGSARHLLEEMLANCCKVASMRAPPRARRMHVRIVVTSLHVWLQES